MTIVSKQQVRDDILASVCVLGVEPCAQHLKILRTLTRQMKNRFCFWELIIIDTLDRTDEYLPLINEIPNLRLFAVQKRHGIYRERVIAATEAIGDVIAVTAIDEVQYLDIATMVERATDEARLIQSIRNGISTQNRLLERPILALGHAAGFNISLENLQTIAMPRARMAQIMSHPDRELALRFPPRDLDAKPSIIVASGGGIEKAASLAFQRRIGLLERVLVNLAPRVLSYVSVISGGLAISAIGYLIYVICAWLMLTKLEPGWATLSAMLSLSTAFLGLAICGLSLGLKHIIRQLNSSVGDDIVKEITNVDLFGQMSEQLNVEVQ